MSKYLSYIFLTVISLIGIFLIALLFLALINQSTLNLADILTSQPNKLSHCASLNSSNLKLDNNATAGSTGSKSPSNVDANHTNYNTTEINKLRHEICTYRITYAKYNEWLTRREQQFTASENYQGNVLTIVSVVIALVALALGAGTWFFSSAIAANETKVKDAQQEMEKTQEKFIDFQEIQQMQSDCEQELLEDLRRRESKDHIVSSFMIELRIYLPLLASGDKARIKRAAQALASYVTGYNLPALVEYARYCRSKTPQELHYLFNFALPENEQI